MKLVLWVLLGLLAPACPQINQQDVFLPDHHSGFFKNLLHLPFERRFDFTPYFNVFGAWRPRRPAFHVPDLLPIIQMPKVQVFCDDYLLTVLVDKTFGGVSLSKEEVQLGDGCFSTKDLPHRLVFSYRFNECGMTHEIKGGFGVFSNSLHFNVQEPFSSGRPAPSQVHISCMTTRSGENLKHQDQAALSQTSRTFTIRAMNPSQVYKRGHTVHLQISADLRPKEQLFVQSCFTSASPEPAVKPRHPIIMNKGCVTALGSLHPVTKFVESAVDVVNIELNTTFMIPQMFVHCSVLIAEQRISSGSKSCNYNLIQSRWEELGGDVEVCSCCMSKCRGLPLRSLHEDDVALVTAGPFIIEPRGLELEAPEVDWSFQADAATEDPVTQHPSPVQEDDTQKVTVAVPQTTEHQELKAEAPARHEDLHQWPPVIRSKMEISKRRDGSQSLSYEEEVLMSQDSVRRLKRKQGQRGLVPTLLDFFRRMDDAE